MQESGPQPDSITYGSVLHACGRAGRASAAEDLMSSMIRRGMEPDVRTFCCVLDACAKARDVDRAERIMQNMEARGVTANVMCYTCYMDACVKEGSSHSLAKVNYLLGHAWHIDAYESGPLIAWSMWTGCC